MDKQYFVYIVQCSDSSFYTGITSNLMLRVEQHNFGNDPKAYTHSRRPVVLKFSKTFSDVKRAIAFEKQVKGWSRAKKEALINGDWQEIKRLSNLKKE